jgi:predicted MFS family arabinose efflux permease
VFFVVVGAVGVCLLFVLFFCLPFPPNHPRRPYGEWRWRRVAAWSLRGGLASASDGLANGDWVLDIVG